jgi:hypothetical protein
MYAEHQQFLASIVELSATPHSCAYWPSLLIIILQVEGGCKHRCLEDLQSTTRFVTWSLHTKSTKALRSIMSKLHLPDVLRGGGGAAGGFCSKTGGAQGQQQHQQQQQGSGDTSSAAAGVMIDLLECTLWQRQLGTLSEETVAALVAQVRDRRLVITLG